METAGVYGLTRCIGIMLPWLWGLVAELGV